MKKSLLAIILILCIQLASAEIILSQPKSVYNLGEILNQNIKLKGQLEGIFVLNLDCENQLPFFMQYVNLKEGEEKTLDASLKLNKEAGNCRISAKINNEESKTSNFLISRNIKIQAGLNRQYFFPNESIEINGSAVKENGELINGSLEIFINNVFSSKAEIVSGNFNSKIELSKNTSSGNYNLILNAYDNEKLNSGQLIEEIFILSIPSFLEILTNNAQPGSYLELIPVLYSQDSKEMKENISIIIDSPNQQEAFKKELVSGEKAEFYVSENASFGDWKISAFYENLKAEKHFFIDKNEKIETIFENNFLIIRNVGNVLYKKIIQLEINGNESFTEEFMVDLDIGEEQRFKISAPSGEYDLSIENSTFKNIQLTGSTIEIKRASEISIIAILGIVFLVLICAFLIFYYFKRKRGFD